MVWQTMSHYAKISNILNEIQLNFKQPISSQYQEIDDQIKIESMCVCVSLCINFCFIPIKKFDIFVHINGKMEEWAQKLAHIVQFADSTHCPYMWCIHTFHFSHYIFAESMNFVLFFVDSVWLLRLWCIVQACVRVLVTTDVFLVCVRICDIKWLTCFASFHRVLHHAAKISILVFFSRSFPASIDSDLELERNDRYMNRIFLTQTLWT